MIAPPGYEIFMECINEIVKNCVKRDYRRGPLDITGPCLLGRMLKTYDINNFTKYNMLYLSDKDIYYNSEVAVSTQYPGYRDEQKKFQKSAHYGELYSKRLVFE
jgi:hypothetical protein